MTLTCPEMIEYKKQFYKETDRYHLIAASVFDHAWMDQVAKIGKHPVLFVAEGVFMYLDGEKVKDLILTLQARFPGSELVCEVVTELLYAQTLEPDGGIENESTDGCGQRGCFHFWHSEQPRAGNLALRHRISGRLVLF